MTEAEHYLQKALESVEGAISEFAGRRFNNCANRSYYACFQAAIAALLMAGHRPPPSGIWSHSAVQATFAGTLISRRKLYPSVLRDTLSRNIELRHTADYETELVSEVSAARALRRARIFVQAISERSEERR